MIEKIDWKKCNDLVPAIIQDFQTFDVLMLGFMNKEALKMTIDTNKVHFWSRTKNRIWMKGEESENCLNVVEIKLDCDNDSLLILVKPVGNTCHTGKKSCFDYRINFLSQLEEILEDRIKNPAENSYVSSISAKGVNKIAQKVGEEATEIVIEAITCDDEKLRSESADLLFHFLLLLKYKNIKLSEIIDILKERNRKT